MRAAMGPPRRLADHAAELSRFYERALAEGTAP
jgi:hypothetical protein